MPGTNLLPLAKSPTAAPAVMDASVYGVVIPVLKDTPTDDMFGGTAVDGLTVYQAGPADNYYLMWVRINGTWRSTVMAV